MAGQREQSVAEQAAQNQADADFESGYIPNRFNNSSGREQSTQEQAMQNQIDADMDAVGAGKTGSNTSAIKKGTEDTKDTSTKNSVNSDSTKTSSTVNSKNEAPKRNKGVSLSSSNVFYQDIHVFLEGVEIPWNNVSIQYAVNSVPMASISIPAANFLRHIPENTKVLIVFVDLCAAPDNKEPEYRVLFEGEVSMVGYNITAAGATMEIHAMHYTGYLNLMQLVNQPASGLGGNQPNSMQSDQSGLMVGDIVFALTSTGSSSLSVNMMNALFSTADQIDNMAEYVYLLLKLMLEAYAKQPDCAVSKWYNNKLGMVKGGYKIYDRIYKVRDSVKALNPQISSSIYPPAGGGSYGGGAVYSGGPELVYGSDGKVMMSSTSGRDFNYQGEIDSAYYKPLNAFLLKDEYRWPLDNTNNVITSLYGNRNAPANGSSNHKGLDLEAAYGTPVFAIADGTVEWMLPCGSSAAGMGGNCMAIAHGNGVSSCYMHLSAFKVSQGQQVKQGQLIALSGNTADGVRVFDPHLHFEIRINGSNVNPLPFLTKKPTAEDKAKITPIKKNDGSKEEETPNKDGGGTGGTF